jgi:hypothetical protein
MRSELHEHQKLAEAWIFERSMPVPECGCWIWMGADDGAFGYGSAGRKGKAHRLSWKVHFGPIPEGKLVCHKCDTPLCVNPDHLFLGTRLENMADMVAKGRSAACRHAADKNPNARITWETVKLIRERGLSCKKAGKLFGVSTSQVHNVRSGKSWGATP